MKATKADACESIPTAEISAQKSEGGAALQEVLNAVKVLLRVLGFNSDIREVVWQLLEKYPESDALRRVAHGNLDTPEAVAWLFNASEEVKR